MNLVTSCPCLLSLRDPLSPSAYSPKSLTSPVEPLLPPLWGAGIAHIFARCLSSTPNPHVSFPAPTRPVRTGSLPPFQQASLTHLRPLAWLACLHLCSDVIIVTPPLYTYSVHCNGLLTHLFLPRDFQIWGQRWHKMCTGFVQHGSCFLTKVFVAHLQVSLVSHSGTMCEWLATRLCKSEQDPTAFHPDARGPGPTSVCDSRPTWQPDPGAPTCRLFQKKVDCR